MDGYVYIILRTVNCSIDRWMLLFIHGSPFKLQITVVKRTSGILISHVYSWVELEVHLEL